MSSRRWDILLHEARGQLRGTWMQNIGDAHIDYQSHRGDSERRGVGLGGRGSVSKLRTTPARVLFGLVSRPLGLKF